MKILDCTLRDGGYINHWQFGRNTIAAILDKLEQARIDIIECGFLTGMAGGQDCSLFSSAGAIARLLPQRARSAMFVAMIAIGEKELDPAKLEPRDKQGIQGIRLTFHQPEIAQAVAWAEILMDKGYRVFMQPVGTVLYTDMALLQLVEQMNRLRPYAFYIVDTLGSMYRNDVSHRFYLIDKNMAPEIHLGFHGHNNLQLAFSNAQVLGKIQTKRTLIVDSSVYGMGRGAGNLATELITQYINKNIASRYDVSAIMDIYDEYIAPIRKKYQWGYSMPYHIAASHVCHPNYATYLINRQTLTMKDIEKIIQSIPGKHKVLYDRGLIERLYTQFQSKKIDDSACVGEITALIKGRPLLLLAPGKTLTTHADAIRSFIEQAHPFVISVNFVDSRYQADACFVSNHKRMDVIERDLQPPARMRVILTSNIPYRAGEDDLFVDYDQYTNDDEMISDNAGLMLLKLLIRCGAKEVFLAGFDGFLPSAKGNYYRQELDIPLKEEEALEKQRRIRKQLKELSRFLNLTFLTPSVYEQEEADV